jgi:hypothetical protein
MLAEPSQEQLQLLAVARTLETAFGRVEEEFAV